MAWGHSEGIEITDREVASTSAAARAAAEMLASRCGRKESRRPFKVAYLVNQYPMVSHTFIRREIFAVERRGIAVERIAIRGWDAEVVDADDVAERTRVRYALKGGIGPLLRSSLRCLLADPRQFGVALLKALQLSRRAERPMPYHLIYLAEACLILKWVREAGVDHIHAHFGTNSAEVALLVHALGGPTYSFTVHGPDEFDMAHALHLDKKIAAANFVVAVNSYCRAQLFRRAALSDWSKIKIVHCGLEENFRAGGSEQLPTKRRFVCVGRLCEQKGQLVLLEAFARLQSRLGGCHLVLAGDGEMRREIESRISALNLSGCVTITGWISNAEVRDEILAAEALVLPSFQESLPVVIMEAMALRRPVITTYVAGIPELVTPGETGWLVPAASIDPLVAAMEACVNTPVDDLRRMGETAFRRVTARHDVDVEAAKLVALFCSTTVAGEIDEWQP